MRYEVNNLKYDDRVHGYMIVGFEFYNNLNDAMQAAEAFVYTNEGLLASGVFDAVKCEEVFKAYSPSKRENCAPI